MGYQVGTICYPDRALAENVYFSQVQPTITADGRMNQVQYQNGHWYFNGVQVQAGLPECSIADNYRLGFDLMSLLLATAIVFMVAKVTINFMFKRF